MYIASKQGLVIYYDHIHLPESAWNKSLPRPVIAPLTVSIYFFRDEKAFETTFVFEENLIEKDAPRNKLYLTGQDFYARAVGGIYLSDVSPRGISCSIEDMERNGTLNTIFSRPAPLPKPRWSDLALHEVPIPDAAEAYRAKLEEFYGEGFVFLKRYKAKSFEEFEACSSIQPPYPWTTFQTELLRHPIFSQLPVFEKPNFRLVADGQWFVGGGFHIDAFLASELASGGPYRKTDSQTALNLAQAARTSLWGENYGELSISQLQTPWSKWFLHVAWDKTMVILESSRKRRFAGITCLFATSSD